MSNALPFEDEIRYGDVRKEWDQVLPGLKRVMEFGAHWRPEDIYAMCRNGDAHLYLFEGGFCICGRRQNHYSLEIELHIYAVYSSSNGSCRKYLPFLEGLAKEIGAKTITMESSRRVFEQLGWEVDYLNFKRRV